MHWALVVSNLAATHMSVGDRLRAGGAATAADGRGVGKRVARAHVTQGPSMRGHDFSPSSSSRPAYLLSHALPFGVETTNTAAGSSAGHSSPNSAASRAQLRRSAWSRYAQSSVHSQAARHPPMARYAARPSASFSMLLPSFREKRPVLIRGLKPTRVYAGRRDTASAPLSRSADASGIAVAALARAPPWGMASNPVHCRSRPCTSAAPHPSFWTASRASIGPSSVTEARSSAAVASSACTTGSSTSASRSAKPADPGGTGQST